MATREIIFRGKRKENGDWVHGDLSYHRDGRVYIRSWDNLQFNPAYNAYEIDPATVGQHIGLTDKNGKMIFEDDILDEKRELFTVVYDKPWARFKLQYIGRAIQYPEWNRGVAMEVIGNIHDNPELLEGGRIE